MRQDQAIPDRRRTRTLAALAALAVLVGPAPAARGLDGPDRLDLRLRSRVEADGKYRVVETPASWAPRETAIIVCDMWDSHHCLNAVRRAGEMAPTMDRVLKAARDRGVVIIHAPSSCMDAYADHPARKHATATPRAKAPPRDIAQWCRKIPNEEKGTYPIDQSDGGEDDDPAEHTKWAEELAAKGLNPKSPWKSQLAALAIEPRDYISDGGEEIWSILEDRGVKNVILMGVHLNMCVLGRPFGLRQMARYGKTVALMRDMTDTMYNPKASPYVSHFAGTDLIIEHVEKFVAPSITSDQFLGGSPFRFKDDRRPHVALLISEDEYRTDATLPAFASASLNPDYFVTYVLSPEGGAGDLPGVGILDRADVAVVSVRRRALPGDQLGAIRRFVASGRPIVGLRTANHAFAARAGAVVAPGREAWPGFDAEVWGGHYQGHHGAGPAATLAEAPGVSAHPILAGVDLAGLVGHGSLYKVGPLAGTTTPLLVGSIPGRPAEPVAWVNAPASGNRAFYTSLGHPDDFASPAFNRLLRNAIDWAAGRLAPIGSCRP